VDANVSDEFLFLLSNQSEFIATLMISMSLHIQDFQCDPPIARSTMNKECQKPSSHRRPLTLLESREAGGVLHETVSRRYA
jgi:hypothetical protein